MPEPIAGRRADRAWTRPKSRGFRGRLPAPLVARLRWLLDAACKNYDPELFFDGVAETRDAKQFREARAKAVCEACPVLADCRVFVDHFERGQDSSHWWGIYAGETRRERKTRRRRERREGLRAGAPA